ncbi:hypothetical protein V8E53_007925 [Lactarius tabidus]
MSSTSPSSSSSATASAPTASPTFSCSELSPCAPIWHGCIGVGVFILFSICILRYTSRGASWREFRLAVNHNANTRRSQNENVATSDRPSDQPEMFDARMGERASGDLEWEKSSIPLSMTILTDPDTESNDRTSHTVRKGKAGKNRGSSAREKEREREEQDDGSPRLRAAVLVAMPSPLHAQSHVGHAASGSSLADELAIGVFEMPWIQEDHHSHKRNAS